MPIYLNGIKQNKNCPDIRHNHYENKENYT